MNFGYLYIRSPNGKTPWKKSPPGDETPCLWRTEKPQNCTPKMPNVTSETHRKWCFWFLFPLAVAMNFSYLYIRSPNGKTPWKKSLRQILLPAAASSKTASKKSPPGGETPCLWRTEKPQNCTPKMPNVTSETHRKWCFWLLFPLAAAMNFGYLFLLLLQRLLLLLRLVPRWKNTMEKITSRQGNTIPLKDGEAPKLHPENA